MTHVSLRHSTYHKTLRASAIVTASIFAFVSGIVISDTRALTVSTERYLATVVSMTASVPPTELNALSTELKTRSDELDRREREIDARARTDVFAQAKTTYIIGAILLMQLCLIVANYVLDYRRGRRRSNELLVSQAH
jgi:hypothetical protein